MLPLSLFRNLRELSFVSILSVCSVMLIIFVVGIEGVKAEPEPGETPEFKFIEGEAFTAFGTMVFAYVCHDVAFQVHQSLSRPTQRRWATVSHGAIAIAMVFSITMCLLGYLSFFDTVKSNVLNNFSEDNSAANVARFVLAATIVMTYPLNLFMSRHVVARIMGKKGAYEFTTLQHIVITLALFAVSVLLGTTVEDLGLVQSLVGGLSAVAIAFVFPAACALQVGYLVHRRPWLHTCNWRQLLLLAFGIVVSIVSVVQTIQVYFF